MAIINDPFGTNTFGGTTSIPGGTSVSTPTIGSTDLSKTKGATKWVGDTSNLAGGKAYWNPTGSGWQEINEGMLSNPEVAQAVMSGAGAARGLYMAPGGVQASNTWSALQNKINPSVIQGIQGSTNSLAPEVLAKMWR